MEDDSSESLIRVQQVNQARLGCHPYAQTSSLEKKDKDHDSDASRNFSVISIEDVENNTAKTLEVTACPRISLDATTEFDKYKLLSDTLHQGGVPQVEEVDHGNMITSESNIVFRPTNGSVASNSYISMGGSQYQNSHKKFDDRGQVREQMSPEILIEAVSDRDVLTGELKSEMTDGDRDGFIYHQHRSLEESTSSLINSITSSVSPGKREKQQKVLLDTITEQNSSDVSESHDARSSPPYIIMDSSKSAKVNLLERIARADYMHKQQSQKGTYRKELVVSVDDERTVEPDYYILGLNMACAEALKNCRKGGEHR